MGSVKGIILLVTTALYASYIILTLDPLGFLLNLSSLFLFSLEIFHVLDAKKASHPSASLAQYIPMVSIHVPIYKEPIDVVRKTLKALAELDYPNYEVCVIVNNTNESESIKAISDICDNLGERFRFFHLPYVQGFKAGALNYALTVTHKDAEVIAIVDSDYVVERDFLKKTVGYFKDPDVAIVQTPQDYRDFPKKGFFEGMYYAYRYFFSIVMNSCNRHNAASFMGTMGLVRKKCLEEVGGWREDVITEDSELGIRIHERGYRSIYLDHSYGKGLMPMSFSSYKKQRFRWAFGNMQTLRENIGILLRGNLTLSQRICYIGSNTIWFNNLLLPFLVTLYGIIFEISDKLSIGLFGPYIAFLMSRTTGIVITLPRMEGITISKGVYAFLSFLSITFPMSTAWLLCLVKPRIPFYRTPKILKRNSLWKHLKEVGIEIIMLLGSLILGIIAFIKAKLLLGFIVIINFLIYLPSIWALNNFVRLEKLSEKGHTKEFNNEDRYNLSALEASTT